MTIIEVTQEGYEEQERVVTAALAAWQDAQAAPKPIIEQDDRPDCPDGTHVSALRNSYLSACERLASMQVVDVVDSCSYVAVGSFIVVEIDGERTTMRIDGCVRSDDTNGVENITVDSPLGRALIGCRVGAEVTYVVEAGHRHIPYVARVCKIWQKPAVLVS